MKNLRVIGLDADDTLWHNEIIFQSVQERFRALLAQYHDAAAVDRTLLATERRNIEPYGYGIRRLGTHPSEFLMVGNSLKSDVLPVLEVGAAAAHVPYKVTWASELSDQVPDAPDRFFKLTSIREVPGLPQ